jgi:hypothetical protein
MKKYLLVGLLALVFPASAQATKFGLSTENLGDFRRLQSEMPVSYYAPFVQFKHNNGLDVFLHQARVLHTTPMISWETWDAVNQRYAANRQPQPLPGLRNGQVASGSQDRYIKRQARYVKAYKRRVYLRFDHEMNGFWYPWSHGRAKYYVRMWRHVWWIFHRMHVRNVRWVWSPNPNTYQGDLSFDRTIRRYWPGKKYVDIVGTTLTRNWSQGVWQPPAQYFARFDRLLKYHKPMWITESLVDLQEMQHWMPLFRQEVDARPYIKTVIWLSTNGAQQPRFGNLNWKLTDQPFARIYLTFKPGYTAPFPPPGS